MTAEPTDLLGTWTLVREVDDRLAGETREVAGSTILARVADDHVRWTEAGVMRWPGNEVPVERTLDVRRGPGGGWTVHFADGRVFHPWTVGEPVEHLCAPDHYRGRIDVAPDRRSWTVTWHSTGPAKDYVLRSRLTRVSGA